MLHHIAITDVVELETVLRVDRWSWVVAIGCSNLTVLRRLQSRNNRRHVIMLDVVWLERN